MCSNIPVRSLMLVICSGLLCASRASSQPRRPAGADPLCRVTAVRDTPLTVGGRAAYVEPQAFVANGDRVLLAGTPTLLWETSGGRFEPVSRDSAMGAVLDAPDRGRPLSSPVAARLVNDVRAAAAGAERWAVVFAEAEPVPPQESPRVTAYWFGFTDGVRWSNLLRLPITEGAPRSVAASALVRTARGFALAVPMDRGNRRDVLVLEWDGARSHASVVETKAAAYVALARSGTDELLLAVVRGDTTETSDENSLFVYRREPTRVWRVLPRQVRGAGHIVRDPSVDRAGSSAVLTWLATPPGTVPEAHAVIVSASLSQKDPVSLLLGRGVRQVLATVHGELPLWVVAPSPEHVGGERVRLLTRHDEQIVTLADTLSQFRHPIAADWLGDALLLSSGVAGRAATDPPVRSRTISIDLRCGTAP